ncbi:uncharacterized protein LOC114164360 isoform X2 [Vigna unguiculata]|uniref:uncharacterized protein LOC114164360 isoform X2 n=1 Tax=Vigna unguiculata TaxID=3917 RepID=UPI0010161726|nr:uncharacterized protein LOC114164360 isoform X2 [Vigna unguiculata]
MTQIKSTHETTNPLSVNENGEPNFPERSKHSEDENRESDGLRSGIDEKTSMDDVRAPNVFERAKEEFQALSEVFHHKRKVSASDIRDENQMAESSKHNQEATTSPSANIFVKAKEEIKGMIHHDKSKHHHKETHGRNDDITENTPLDEIKGPNVFERVKEEFEAVFQAIHPK